MHDRGLDASEEARRQLVAAWHALDPWPDVKDGLEQLRSTQVVATLSNGHVAMLVDLARHGDLRFDAILSAELTKRYKPSRETYLAAAGYLAEHLCPAAASPRAPRPSSPSPAPAHTVL